MNPLRTFFKALLRERPQLSYGLPVALGAGVVVYFLLPFEPSLSALIITPVLAALTWAVQRYSWPLTLILFTLTLMSLGFSASKIEAVLDERPMLDSEIPLQPISGRVASTDIMPDGIRLTLLHPHIGSLPEARTPEKVRVKFNEMTLDDAPPPGAEVVFTAQLNGFSEPVAPSAADFRRQAYYQHLGGLGWSRDSIAIRNPAPEDYTASEAFSLALERARKTLAHHVYARLDGDVAAITAARLNGEQTGITSPVMNAMRIAGLSHLLATSGANVTIMGLLIYFPLRMLLALSPWLTLRFPIKKWAAIAAVFSALAFTFLVGSQAATARSMVMVGLAMLAILVDRNTHPMRLLMLSALLSMLFAPSATMGPSFQMSFAAVFCLIASVRRKEGKSLPLFFFLSETARPFFSSLYAIVRTTLIATVATTPFTVYHFQTFNLYGALSNVLAIPLSSFWVMPFTIMAYLTAPLGWDGFFIDMAGIGNALTIRIATTVASWPHALISMPAMPGPAFVAVIAGGLWLCLIQGKIRLIGLLPILIGSLYPLYTSEPDVFVSPSGRVWGIVLEDGRLAVSSTRREKFVTEQWKQRLGNVALVDADTLLPNNRQILCDDEGCVYRHGCTTFAMPTKEASALEDCLHADLVIAPFLITSCSAKVIDKQALTLRGAHAITFKGDTPQFQYVREAPGQRPWSVGWKQRAFP